MGALVLAMLLNPAGVVRADEPGSPGLDRRIAAARDGLDGTAADLVAAQAALRSVDARAAAARGEQTRAEQQLRTETAQHARVSARLTAARRAEQASAGALAANRAAQARTRVLVGGLARRSYMQGPMGSLGLTLDVLTSPGTSAADDLSSAEAVLRRQGGLLGRLRGEEAAGRAELARLTAQRQQVAALEEEAAASLARAQAARDSAGAAARRLQAEQRRRAEAAARLRERADAQRRDLQWLEAEAARLSGVLRRRAVARGAQAVAPAPAPGGGRPLTAPRPVSQIVSGFGYRLHPILRVRRLHAGVDYALACGTPVLAAADGEVVSAGADPVAGNNVVLDHGRLGGVDLATRYEHLSRIVVSSGRVRRGELIGLVGTTGRSTGCHLHLAVLEGGRYVDPEPWLG